MVTFVHNPSGENIESKLIDIDEGRDHFGVRAFEGEYGALHSVIGDHILNEVILVFINQIAYPVISPEVVEMILKSEPITPGTEIKILTESGVKSFLINSLEYEMKEEPSYKFNGKISLNIWVGPDIDCECYDEDGKENKDMVSDYYWCEHCDDMWDYTDRTEVSLSGSKKIFHVPNNLLVVATMNTTDRSVAPLDAALRRRFVFLRVDRLDKIPRKAKRNLDSEKLKIFNETEKLWIKLNENLKTTLGHDATIGHSYLFDLIKELERAKSIDMCYELRKQFWQYSVLPQVADLLDATGRSNSVWVGMKMEKSFKRIGLGLDTGPEKFKSFARTIIVEVEDDEEESIDTNQTEEESETTEDTEATEPSSVESA